jgi:hypothetical protein
MITQNHNIKILVLITVWKRPHVFRVMAQNLFFPEWIDAKIVCVLSENDPHLNENLSTCNLFSFETMFADNLPIGNKRNEGLKHGLSYDWQYYFKIDSDDLVHPGYWDIIRPYIDGGIQFVGMGQHIAYDTESEESRIIKYKCVIGGGKFIHRGIVERCLRKLGYLYPPDQNSGLDNTSTRNIYQVTKFKPFIVNGCYLLDIKTLDNINHYRSLKGLENELITYEEIKAIYGDVAEQLKQYEQKGSV